MELPQDPIEQLEHDHRTAEALFAQFGTATGDERREVLQAIVRELSIHAVVEEQAVYPAMRATLPDGDAAVDHAIEEHQKVKEVLADLDGADPDDEEVATKVHNLAREVTSHVAEEEKELLPQLRSQIAPEAFTEMAAAAEAARAGAPTRPHPHAPNSGPGQAIAGAVAGVVDRARDAIRR